MRPLILLVAAASATALASNEYPGEITRTLAACRTPACTICHTSNRGGVGTATRAFAITMQNEGLTGSRNLSALRTALARVEAAEEDSDGDGVADIPELKQGSDPSNSASKTSNCTTSGGGSGGGAGGGDTFDPAQLEPPRYGCGASAAPGGLAGVLAWVIVSGAMRYRRRRRS